VFRHKRIVVERGEVPKFTIHADRHLANTVLRKVLGNAMKFTE
jgi:hypothetical protein